MKNDEKIGHIRESDKKTQTLNQHLFSVAELTSMFASKIDLGQVGYIIGLLHDLGKSSMQFQNYLKSAVGVFNPDCDGYVEAETFRGRIDHSTAGAQIFDQQASAFGKLGKLVSQAISLCLVSHHSGLIDSLAPDGTDIFTQRIKKDSEQTNLKEAEAYYKEFIKDKADQIINQNLFESFYEKAQNLKEKPVNNKDIQTSETYMFKFGLLVRFLFSCLIDADRLDTANFEDPKRLSYKNSGKFLPWDVLIQRLENKLKSFPEPTDPNDISHVRTKVSQTCLEFSQKDQGIFQLNVPTGGGKTLASLRFGLYHAKKHKLDHVIYVIPFTSIIDQNADEVRKILEDKDNKGKFTTKVVLEHHSNLTPEKETGRQSLLAENWDAPIIFTTQVQFFETLFGGGTRNARRMHQLAKSVIIFDEVQTIPVKCIYMFNLALRFLTQDCGSTVMLCTATQPLLDEVIPFQQSLPLSAKNKIIQNDQALYDSLKRVEVINRVQPKGWTSAEIADLAKEQFERSGSVLIVTNTKASAKNLFLLLKEQGNASVYHLSTNMCPANRLVVLNAVREKLKENKPVICVSTQLIEAGVDVDFGCVIRYLAGLDSIIQAAGRCNRHGKRGIGKVFVVNANEENLSRLKEIRTAQEKTLRVWEDYQQNPTYFRNNPAGLEAVKAYYQYYFYERKDEMSYRVGQNSPVGRDDNLFSLLSTNYVSVQNYRRINASLPQNLFVQSFRSAADSFSVIDQNSRGVIVPFGNEGKEIINKLGSASAVFELSKLLKQAQRFSINIYCNQIADLAAAGAIAEIHSAKKTGIYRLYDEFYNEETGLDPQGNTNIETLFF